MVWLGGTLVLQNKNKTDENIRKNFWHYLNFRNVIGVYSTFRLVELVHHPAGSDWAFIQSWREVERWNGALCGSNFVWDCPTGAWRRDCVR